MSDSRIVYGQNYREAADYFNQHRWHNAIVTAKYNLTDETLPRYWQMRNCIIVCRASLVWNECEQYLQAAEQVYSDARAGTRPHETHSLETLAQLRRELDEIKEDQVNQAPDDEDDVTQMDEDDEADEKDEDEDEEEEEEEEESLREQDDKADFLVGPTDARVMACLERTRFSDVEAVKAVSDAKQSGAEAEKPAEVWEHEGHLEFFEG